MVEDIFRKWQMVTVSDFVVKWCFIYFLLLQTHTLCTSHYISWTLLALLGWEGWMTIMLATNDAWCWFLRWLWCRWVAVQGGPIVISGLTTTGNKFLPIVHLTSLLQRVSSRPRKAAVAGEFSIKLKFERNHCNKVKILKIWQPCLQLWALLRVSIKLFGRTAMRY